ncbi:MAG: PDZ domain-containing protein [Pyrinomonadaceae bacterium]
MTKQLGEHFGVSDGVMINNIRKDSPADKAGLRAGDIIVEVDGKAINNDFDLIRGIGEKKQGDVSLTIVRDRNRQTINVTPEENKGEINTFFEGFDAPSAPGVFKMAVPAPPATPGAPIPLNRLYLPGRVL